MSRADQSSRRPATVVTILGCAALLSFGAARIATQSRIIRPQPAANSNNTTKRQRVATLRASDSPEGSRVALTSDQSLSDYEAYRRGDRFYVKIPPSDVPRSEIVRGRAFADVKVQRGADSTVVSFRLQPGATARVEQSANKLNVVFTMPGARPPASNSGRDVARNDAGPAPPSDQRRRPSSNSNTSSANSNRPGANRNAADSNRAGANRNAADRTNAATAKPTPTPKPSPSPTAKPSAPPRSSPATKASPLVAQQKASPSGSPALVEQAPQGLTWNSFKERVRYWILLAQLNPVPVGIGAAVLLLLIGLFVFQRRRAKGTRRVHPRKEPKRTAPVVEATKATNAVAEVPTAAESGAAILGATAATSSLAAASASDEPGRAPRVDGDRHERVARVSEEVKKVMAGGDYDEAIVASDDRETRQLVGAELLSALVGRNLQRRERARAVFMKHGYFDDATRDLRTAESDNERAAAARRLSFVHDREATPHLIGALDDPSPDVRHAAVEALMDLRDPAAIAPLNSLMQTETDRKVPRSLIKHAIEACASSGAEVDAATPAASSLPPASAEANSQPSETEREVIEI
jgi:hypothetical protein